MTNLSPPPTVPARRLLLLAAGSALVGCASAPEPKAMQARAAAPARATPAPGSVQVTISGGSESGALDGPWISAPDFKTAVESSLMQARAFEGLAEGAAARYALGGNIVRVTRPMWGLNFEVTAEIGWSLVDRRQGDRILLRKALTSTGAATVSDTLVGAKRIRMAVEAAARASIEALLSELAPLAY